MEAAAEKSAASAGQANTRCVSNSQQCHRPWRHDGRVNYCTHHFPLMMTKHTRSATLRYPARGGQGETLHQGGRQARRPEQCQDAGTRDRSLAEGRQPPPHIQGTDELGHDANGESAGTGVCARLLATSFVARCGRRALSHLPISLSLSPSLSFSLSHIHTYMHMHMPPYRSKR